MQERPFRPEEELRTVGALVIDMDGVLWRGEEALPGLTAFFAFLRQRGIAFRLATNNPTLTPEQYVGKLRHLGVEVDSGEILTSGMVTAGYVASRSPGASVFLIGSDGLREVLLRYGLCVTASDYAEYVVVGLDRQLTYDRLVQASLLIRDGAGFIGCNPDRTLPSERGLIPGNGATLAYLEASTDVAPVVIGKPKTAIFEAALEMMGVKPGVAATLGDRLETDILGGQRAGLRNILVLSGVTDQALLEKSEVQPDWVFDGIQSLTERWESVL